PKRPHLVADDDPRCSEQGEQQEPAREPPVDHLRARHHPAPPSRSSASGRATTLQNRSPARTTYSGDSPPTSHQKPWPCGWRTVRRYGCASAQTSPPAIAAGPSASTTRARSDRVRGFSVVCPCWKSCAISALIGTSSGSQGAPIAG